MQQEGRVRFVGFSTHATTDIILEAVQSDEFDYLNVHWYFVNDLNWPPSRLPNNLTWGVFIISRTTKAEKLYETTEKVGRVCAPPTPMQFNDLYASRGRRFTR